MSLILAMIASVALVTIADSGTVVAAPCDEPIANEIACENSKPGNPPSEWDISGAGSFDLQGFATDISVAQGDTVGFKVDTTASAFRLDIYRMGYYGGDGARLVDSITPALVTNQPNCLNDPSTGLVDCGNWSESASWNVPADAVSGIYFAKLVRTDGPSGSSHIVFIVRDDDGNSDVLFQTADTTWQAYNDFGGNSLYTGQPAGRAYKVSYNRPFTTRNNAPEDWVFNAEYPMVRYLEANGYDVSYTTGIDSDRLGAELLEHSIFLSVGHDEYWSGSQRANVEAARDAGVNLAFMSGNEVYWKTRWEPSIDGSSTPYRTLVSYKETADGAITDPAHPTWTGTWRDLRFSPPADGGRPENGLTGTIFRVNCCAVDMVVGAEDGDMRFWRNTRVEALSGSQTTTVGSDIIGYEWDEDLDNGFRPAGLFRVSETFASNQDILLDEGSVFGPGSATHAMTMYRAPSGALVFGAGTVQWAWGLDSQHDRGPSNTSDVAAQQATVNLFADMGVQPATLQPGLVPATASTDAVAPTSAITSPADAGTVPANSNLTVTGTAVDAGGGQVGGVEVSVDGGATWGRAEGRTNWTYTFNSGTAGSLTILSRATDDSANLEAPSAGVTVTVGGVASCPCSIWDASAQPDRTELSDTNSVEVGVVFDVAEAGYITGIRFHKATSNTGTHVGSLWTSTGSLLGSVTFTNESGSGWQQANFANPIPVDVGTTYVASYFAPNGQYSASSSYFTSGGVTNGPLTALANGAANGNGRYVYTSSAGTFPGNTYQSENYWVDVVFDANVTDTTPPSIVSQVPAADAVAVSVGATVSATFNEPVTGTTIAVSESGGPAVAGSSSYDAGSRTITFTPSAALGETTGYSVTVSGATDASGNTMSATNWTFTTAGPAGCPCSIWDASAQPDRTELSDTNSIEVGVVFDVALPGYITGIRFHKATSNTGTHLGHLWTSTGTLLGSVTFTNETASGWQQADFSNPIPVDPGTTYVASYFAPNGRYSASSSYFTSGGVNNGPLTALSTAAAGGNGRYVYTGTAGTFPQNTYQSENYWVDVVYDTSAVDTSPPGVSARVPSAGATGVSANTSVSATFDEPVSGATVTLDEVGGSTVSGSSSYDAGSRTITFTPSGRLNDSTGYTVAVAGAVDNVGNPMTPTNWTFTTGGPPPPLPTEGPGGPIGVVTAGTDAFSGYFAEILRSEGLNEFETFDVSGLDAAKAATFTTILLGPVSLTASQVSMLTSWVGAGGNLVASRPDPQLAGLLGLTPVAGTLSDAYLAVDTALAPGTGIVSDTMQFHGTADRYTLTGATAVATLYSDATTSTGSPAVTIRNVGPNGGQAAAFTYDLARSVVLTRQGNPAWAGQERDGGLGDGIVRTSDMYFGGSQADWVNLDKIAIPQADEQQRLLANIVQHVNRDAFPLPRFWYFPDDHRAVVIATGDDHANGGTAGRFDAYLAASPPGCSVADWECPRITSYVYPGTLSNSAAAGYEAQGFEIAPHVQNGCRNFTSTNDLRSTYTSEVASFANAYPSVSAPVSNRFHCLVWSDWESQFVVESENGIRFDANYYYWPPNWVNDRPGFMTGSGMPQRFSHTDGTMVDVYQGATQMTDESGQSYPFTVNALLDRALGVEGYYGYFVTNHHTDSTVKQEDSATLAAAQTRGVPVVTARAALEFIDGRNASSFANLAWASNALSFDINVGTGANNLTAMLPIAGPAGTSLTAMQRSGSSVSFQTMTIKGIQYARFDALAGSYVASYEEPTVDTTAPTVAAISPSNGATGVAVTDPVAVTFSEPVVGTSVQIVVTPSGGAAVAGTTSYSAATNTATFTPTVPLASNTTFTVDISGATDAAGNTMAPVAGTFTTGVVDVTPPVVSAVVPGDGAVDVAVGSSVAVTFSEPVVDTSVVIVVTPSGGAAVAGTTSYSAGTNTATFTPSTALAPSTTYTIDISGATDPSGNVMGPVSVAFATGVVDVTEPVVSAVVPGDGAVAVAVGSSVAVTFSEPVVDTSVVIAVTAAGGAAVAGTTSYSAGTNTATFTPSGPLANGVVYTVDVSGATDAAGNTMAPAVTTFTTVAAGVCPCNIFGSVVPPVESSPDGAVELGVKFQASVDGTIDGIRFYKGAGNTGTHVGNLWTSTGTLLGTVTFTNESATGWQEATFASPVPVTAGTTYVASYHAPNGGYSLGSGGFATEVVNGPLTALASAPSGGNGLYVYGGGGFPTSSFNSSNYYVDVIFTDVPPPPDVTEPVVSAVVPGDGAVDVAVGSSVAVTFSEPVVDTSVVIAVTAAGGAAVAGTTSYSAGTNTATFTPSGPLANGVVYTVDVSGATDAAGNTMAPAATTFTTTAATDVTEPVVSAVVPGDGAVAVAVGSSVAVTFSEPVVDTSVVIAVTAAGGAAVAGTTSYDVGTNTATFTPSGPLANGVVYTVDVSGATDAAGNTMAPAVTTFTTVAAGVCPCNIFGSVVPPVESSPDGAVELGVKFQASVDGTIDGIRFYKGAGNTGTHVGNLWTSTGTLLGTVTFTNESATGWQEATFASPVPVTAGTTYVASYHAPNGGYSLGSGGFATEVVNGPLTALASAPSGGNGLYVYGGGGFPTSSFNSSNYYVDVIFTGLPSPPDVTEPVVSAVVPGDGAVAVAVGSSVAVTFSEPVVDTSVVIAVTAAGGAAVAGTTSYDVGTNTATFTPSGPLANGVVYTVDVSGATDAAGNTMAPAATTFTTTAAPQSSPTVYLSTVGNTSVPGVGGPDDADIYSWDGAAFARVFDAAGAGSAGLPGGADVDAYDRVDATSFYLSFTGDVAVPGIGTVQDEDVVFFDGTSWSLYFDGTALGLTSNGHDVDAVSVDGSLMYFSTVGNSTVPGVGSGDDADIYSWDGVAFTRFWDASAAGLPGSADIDALRIVDPTTFYASFNSTDTTVPGLGALPDVSVGLYSAGVWSLSFDGVSSGLVAGTGHDVDAFDIAD